jgi:hypothetical protein
MVTSMITAIAGLAIPSWIVLVFAVTGSGIICLRLCLRYRFACKVIDKLKDDKAVVEFIRYMTEPHRSRWWRWLRRLLP